MRGEEVRDAAQGNHAADAAAAATVRYETHERKRKSGEGGEKRTLVHTLVHRDAGASNQESTGGKGDREIFKEQMKLDRGDVTYWRHWQGRGGFWGWGGRYGGVSCING